MQSLALAFRHGVSVRASHSLSVHLQSPVRLAASVMLASMALGASAQQADSLPPAAGQLDDVVVSANRAPRKADAVVADVSVLTRADLARLDGLTLTQALARLPGIQFTSNGGRGKSSSLFVRGNESTQTVLIVDGVRLGSATLGQPSLDNLPIDQIERIEVVRGNMSALYGPDAMGGVIHVFTRQGAQGLSLPVKVGVGSYGLSEVAGQLSYRQAEWELSLQAQRQQDSGFSATNPQVQFGNHNPDRDGFRQHSAGLNWAWHFAPGWTVRMQGLQVHSLNHFDDGVPATGSMDTLAVVDNRVQGLSLTSRVTDQWTSELRLSQAMDRSETVRAVNSWNLGHYQTQQELITWQHNVQVDGLGDFVAAVEHKNEEVEAATVKYDQDARKTDGMLLGWNQHWGAHVLELNWRRDRTAQYGAKSTGGLGYAFTLSPEWRVHARVANSFVAPSFNQLYYPNYGNPALKPQQSVGSEVGVRWHRGASEVQLLRFDQRIRNFISAGQLPQNVPHSRIDGWTLSGETRLGPVRVDGSMDWTDPRNEATGALLNRRAQRVGHLGADWVASQEWSAGADWTAVSYRVDGKSRLGGYGLLNLRAQWQVAPGWQVLGRVNNVAGKSYTTAYGYNQPGREWLLSLRWTPKL